MNNKGFAITSVIYGLSVLGIMIILILMGTLSSSRNNIKETADQVESFLLAVNQTEVVYRDSGKYTVPQGETGYYRIEVFGQRDCSDGGANGAYATGIVLLHEGDKLDINIGNCVNGINTNVSTVVGAREEVIISAGRGIGSSPGGTVVNLRENLPGSKINLSNFSLASGNYTGFSQSNYFTTGDNKSYIRGYPMFCSESRCTYRDFMFFDGMMLPGASALTSGKIIIERLANSNSIDFEEVRKDSRFNNVKKVMVESDSRIDKIYLSYTLELSGNDLYVKTIDCGGQNNCELSLSRAVYVDEVNVTFNHTSGVDGDSIIRGTVITFVDGSNRNRVALDTIRGLSYGVPDTTVGIHLSAYQPDLYTGDYRDNGFSLHGNFYLFPITQFNKVLSASSSSSLDSNKLYMEYMTGEARQKWSLDALNGPEVDIAFSNISNASGTKEYRVMELARYKALSLYYDENFAFNNVVASDNFNTLSRNEPQIWNVYPLNDGTYAIKTVVEPLYSDKPSGFLLGLSDVSDGDSRDHINEVVVGGVHFMGSFYDTAEPTDVERFYLYSLDFSR